MASPVGPPCAQVGCARSFNSTAAPFAQTSAMGKTATHYQVKAAPIDGLAIGADYVDYDGVEGATEQSPESGSYYLTYAIGPTTIGYSRTYLATAIGLAFRKLDVFGYFKFVTAAKNINLLPNRKSMFQQKKMKAISGFAFKGLAGAIAGIYLILFTLSFWNIHSYNKKLKNYQSVKETHIQKQAELKKVSKELKLMQTTLQLSNSLKSNKELTYRVLAQVASSVPTRVRFDSVEYNGSNLLTIQGIAASDQDILKFIENLGKQKLIDQASLSSMRLPQRVQGGATMKGFRVFVKIKT